MTEKQKWEGTTVPLTRNDLDKSYCKDFELPQEKKNSNEIILAGIEEEKQNLFDNTRELQNETRKHRKRPKKYKERKSTS